MATISQLLKDGTISLDTQVLGVLPMTEDHAIAGQGAEVFYWRGSDLCGAQIAVESESQGRKFYSCPDAAIARATRQADPHA